MSDAVEPEFTVKELVLKWSVEYGRIPFNQRLEALIHLVETLKDFGYGKEANNAQLQRVVLDELTRPSKGYKDWSRAVLQDLDRAFAKVYVPAMNAPKNITPQFKLEDAEPYVPKEKSSASGEDVPFLSQFKMIDSSRIKKIDLPEIQDNDEFLKEMGMDDNE